MTRSILAGIAAASLIAAAAPAPAALGAPRMKYDEKTGTYCTLNDATLGSRIRRAECHTVAAWARQGLTIDVRPKVASR